MSSVPTNAGGEVGQPEPYHDEESAFWGNVAIDCVEQTTERDFTTNLSNLSLH